MTVRERPTDVVVLRETELARWLQRHPVTLPPEQVQHIAGAAAQPAAWKRMPEADTVDHAAFDRLRRAVERARRRRVLWVGAAIATMPFAFVAVWSTMLGMVMAR